MARFNEETPDDPDVKYVSYGAEFTPSWSNAFRIPWGIVSEREGASRARSAPSFLFFVRLSPRPALSPLEAALAVQAILGQKSCS